MSDAYSLQLPNGDSYPYLVINSKRAKYIRIKLSNIGELSVVLPKRASIHHAHEFLQTKAQWIEKHLENITPASANTLPENIDLKLLGENWIIDYRNSDNERIELLEKPNSRIEIVGNIEDIALVKKVINLWCKKKAKQVFSEMLEELAELHGFHYNRLSIRSQKTRWGSCSANKNINLNSKLLLMSEGVVRYVMIHELCHTIEMNHSSRFWHLVKDCDPEYLLNRKSLKAQGKKIFL